MKLISCFHLKSYIFPTAFKTLQLSGTEISKFPVFELPFPMTCKPFVTDVGDQMFWWQVWDVGDRFGMLMTALLHLENHQDNEKSCQHNDSTTNISNQTIEPIRIIQVVMKLKGLSSNKKSRRFFANRNHIKS